MIRKKMLAYGQAVAASLTPRINPSLSTWYIRGYRVQLS
jgi:hypothetical protein